MTVLLLLLMAYELIGQAAHEWIDIWQTILVAAVLLTMLGSMVSGVILSRHVLSFLPIQGGRSFARNLHMLSAYWGFVFMSLHLGLHWSMMMGIAQKHMKSSSKTRKWILRLIAF